MSDSEERLGRLETEIERRLLERFAALRDEFDRLRLEADRRWAGFLSRFEQDFTGIVPLELVPSVARPAAGAESAGAQVSLEEIQTLDEGENQVEVLRRFLDLCRKYSSRAVLFVSRSGSLEAWKAVGFSARGANDEAVRKVSVALGDAALRRALEGSPLAFDGDNAISRALDVPDASRAVLVPMVVREKISGLVYADSARGEETGFQPERIALLTHLAGVVVDRLASRRLRPSPPLKPFEEAETGPAAAEPQAAAVRPAEEPEELELAPEAPPEAQPPSFASVPHPEEPAAPPPRVAEPPPEPSVPESRAGESSGAAPAAWESEAEAGVSFRDVQPSPPPATQAPPSPPSTTTRRLAGPLAAADGDERREEARRFARLLVSEIKLYNERAVLEGRQHRDLYERLREDIDRSRQMYDERIPEDIRSNSNFFYEEMVRILADGRPDVLGL